MRLSSEITNEELLFLGFDALTEDYIKENNLEDSPLVAGGFVYNVGHSRRGQFYYLIANNGELKIVATQPDGSGGSIALPNILLTMFELGYIV